MASTASRERRHARVASRSPILRASLISGVSISYCTSAVLAVVEPFAGPRLSTTATRSPVPARASAIMAPVMPAPITRTSVSMSLLSGLWGTGEARCCFQIERPVRKSVDFVTTITRFQTGQIGR